MTQAWRGLRRHPGLAAAVVATLALTLGVNTAVFSLVNAVLLRPLPFAEPDRLLFVDRRAPDGELHGFTVEEYRHLHEGAASVVALAGVRDHGFVVEGHPRLVAGMLVSGSYFDVVGVSPHRGRLLTPDDDAAPGASSVAVLSHALWTSAYGADPNIVGRTIRLNRHPFTVVGIAPPGFHGHFVAFPFEVWVPASMAAQVAAVRAPAGAEALHLELMGRMADGRTSTHVREILRAVDGGLARSRAAGAIVHPIDTRPMNGLDESLRRPVLAFLGIFEAAALLVLLAGCANVATLLLVRAAARRREMSIRLALGAGRTVLVRQLLTETMVLFAAGAALGLWLARATAHVFMGFQPTFAIPLRLDVGLDARVVAFSLALTLVAAVAFGLAPALRATAVDPIVALKAVGASVTGRGRLRRGFVFAQVAITAILLTLSGVFVRTMQRHLAVHPGFDPRGVALANVNPGIVGYDEAAGRAFYERLMARSRAVPGVEAVALARRVPLGLGSLTAEIREPHADEPHGRPLTVDFNAVTPEYLDLLRIPLVSGRDFAAADALDAPPVCVVNEALAARLWPRGEAVGQSVRHDGTSRRVVGVARNSAYRSPGEAPRVHLYVPFAQDYSHGMTLLARGRGDTAALVAALHAEARAVDAEVPILTALTMTERLRSSFAPHRLAAALAGSMGLLALVLAAVGLHGVVAFSVGQRVREFGIRAAVGAGPRQILRLVLGEGLRLGAPATAAGLFAGALLGMAVRGVLPGASGADAVTVSAVAMVVLGAALMATLWPARRAARMDAATALRHE